MRLRTMQRSVVAAVAVACALVTAPPRALAQEPPDTGPEDVPADNRFDPALMTSTLVVPRTRVERFRVPVVDAHSHAYAETPEAIAQWVKLLDQVNVRTSFILTGETGAVFRELTNRYASTHPGRFLMFAGFDKTDPAAPDYGERLRRGLREDVKAGAAGLGELSDKGLGLVRAGEKAYFVDDPRFDPLWDEAGKLGVPVFVHIGEPAAFYEPPDAKNELRRSANWSLYGKGTPGFRTMLARTRERTVAPSEDPVRGGARLDLGDDLAEVGALLGPTSIDFSAACGSWGSSRCDGAPLPAGPRRPDPVRHRQRSVLRHVPRARQGDSGDRGRVVLARDAVVARLRNGPAGDVLDKVYSVNADRLLGGARCARNAAEPS